MSALFIFLARRASLLRRKQNSVKCPSLPQCSQWYLTTLKGGCWYTRLWVWITLPFCGKSSSWRGGIVSSLFFRWLGLGCHTWFLGGALGGSTKTPSLVLGLRGSLGGSLVSLGVVVELGFSLGFKPLDSLIFPKAETSTFGAKPTPDLQQHT